MKKINFEKELIKIFGDIYTYKATHKQGTIKFLIQSKDLTYSNLQQVSQLLNTRMINIHSANHVQKIDIHCEKVEF